MDHDHEEGRQDLADDLRTETRTARRRLRGNGSARPDLPDALGLSGGRPLPFRVKVFHRGSGDLIMDYLVGDEGLPRGWCDYVMRGGPWIIQIAEGAAPLWGTS